MSFLTRCRSTRLPVAVVKRVATSWTKLGSNAWHVTKAPILWHVIPRGAERVLVGRRLGDIRVHRPPRPCRPGRLSSSPTTMISLSACSRAGLRLHPAVDPRVVRLSLSAHPASRRLAPQLAFGRTALKFPRIPQRRWASSTPGNPQPAQATSKTTDTNLPSPPPPPKRSFLSRFLPAPSGDASKSASSFKSIVALAKPEKKPLSLAVGLLLISSTVSMSIPFTIGKLIDYFASPAPVSSLRVIHHDVIELISR